MDKSDMVRDLIKVLEDENALYEELLKLSEKKTGIITEGKVSELEAVLKVEQSMIMQVGKLEGMRERLIEKTADELMMASDDITVSALADRLEGPQAESIKNIRDVMVNTVNKLKNVNELNGKLIKNSLDYINFSINIMAGSGPLCNNYASTGRVGEAKNRSILDMKL